MRSDTPTFWLSRLLQHIDSSTGATRIFHVLLAVCVALVIIGWLIPGHETQARKSSVVGLVGDIPGFYGAYGFFMCALLVLAAKALRRLIMRPEDYYGPYSVDSEEVRRDNEIQEHEENAS